MLKNLIYVLMIYVALIGASEARQNDSPIISLDLQEVSLPDALRTIARPMHQNIIVNTKIHADVTLHLHHIAAKKIFFMLLHAHDLITVPMSNAWYITKRTDWIQQQQNQLRLKEAADAIEPLITHIWQIHYAKVDDVARLIQDTTGTLLSKRAHLRVDVRTNVLYVQDVAKNVNEVDLLIKRVDVPIQQILIETHLASVDSDFERNLGVVFNVKNASASGETQANSIFSKTRYGLLVAKLADGSLLDVQLSALENAGHGELISSPRLLTANQQSAAIEAGEEIPYQEESPSGGTSVTFKKAVLSLKVTPQILPGKKVLLQLQVNQDKPSKILIQGVPAINTRQMSTSVLIRDGQTVVLGGIYETDKEHAKQSIPFLGKIPLLGLLFQLNNTIEQKRELLIFVTPRIVPL